MTYRQRAEQALGRPLVRGHKRVREIVHHIDGDRSNNDLSNLVVCTYVEHGFMHNRRSPNLARLVLAQCRRRQGFGYTEEDAAVIAEERQRVVRGKLRMVERILRDGVKELEALR